MSWSRLSLICVLAGSLSLATAVDLISARPAYAAKRAQMSFREDIVPIFRGWCQSCHRPGGEGYKASGLDLRSYAGLMKGTKYGSMVVPGKPDESNLIAIIFGRTSPKISMPFHHKPLPDCLRNDIWTWIFQGAKDN